MIKGGDALRVSSLPLGRDERLRGRSTPALPGPRTGARARRPGNWECPA